MLQIEKREAQGNLDAHFHNAYELIYVLEGRMHIQFSEKSYEVGARGLVAINHLEEHRVRVLEEPYSRYFAILPLEQTDAWVQDRVLLSLLKNRPRSFCHVLDVQAIAPALSKHFEGLRQEYLAQSAPYHGQRMAAWLRLILSEVYRNQPGAFPIDGDSIHDPIFETQTYIDRHFDQPMTIRALAERVYLSESALSHQFQRQTGHSPKQYLTLTRLAHAKTLLLSGKFSVEEVCAQSGFGDVTNFIRRFRQQYGQTPGQLRLSDKEDHSRN